MKKIQSIDLIAERRNAILFYSNLCELKSQQLLQYENIEKKILVDYQQKQELLKQNDHELKEDVGEEVCSIKDLSISSPSKELRNQINDAHTQKILLEHFPALKSRSGSLKSKSHGNDLVKSLKEQNEELLKRIEKMEMEFSKLKSEKKEWLMKQHKLTKFTNEKTQFEIYKQKDLDTFNQWKELELKKLKKEKLLWEKQKKAAEIIPSKREREEINILKKQMIAIEYSFKEKEQRLILSQDRLKRRLNDLNRQNNELADEVKLLEQDRLKLREENEMLRIRFKILRKPSILATSPQQNHYTNRASSSSAKLSTISNICGDDQKENTQPISMSQVRKIQSTPHLGKRSPAKKKLNQSPSTAKTIANINTLKIMNIKSNPISVTTTTSQQTEVHQSPPYSNHNNKNNDDIKTVNVLLPSAFNRAIVKLDALSQTLHLTAYLKEFTSEDRISRIYPGGIKLEAYLNGVTKEVHPTGYTKYRFLNGDTKEILANGNQVYFYSENNSTRTDFKDGGYVLVFEDGQVVRHQSDGMKQVEFPDLTVKYYFPDGTEETVFPNGDIERIDPNGKKRRVSKVIRKMIAS